MTFIVLIANYWTPHTPMPFTYALTFIGDLVFIMVATAGRGAIKHVHLNGGRKP